METHNQPSHEFQNKGGQQSHQGNEGQTYKKDENPGDKRTPRSKEEASKGGQHSHSGGNR